VRGIVRIEWERVVVCMYIYYSRKGAFVEGFLSLSFVKCMSQE
jgi:hypothetical protein